MSQIEEWQPLSVEELTILFKKSVKDFWISGGWAIDLFLGKKTRNHEDLDISISRTDQNYFQSILKDWDLRASDPPGSGQLRPWKNQEFLNNPVYNIWSRKIIDGPWNLEIFLCDFENGEWVYRRNKKIRGPFEEFGWTNSEGLKIISPVIQLLYKSRNPRSKDDEDFQNCLNVLSQKQTVRLKTLLLSDSEPAHPWIQWL